MKLLKDEKEMAMAVNFREYPVLSIDLADADDYGLKGCAVRIDAGKFSDGKPYTIDAELRVYRDEKKLTTSAGAVFLDNSFTYSDYTDMVKNAQAPLIGPDQDVVVAIYDSRLKKCYYPMIVHTGKSVARHCITPLSFEPVDMTQYLLDAGVELRETAWEG